MAGVSFAAHGIVAHFGIVGGLATIAAMYGAAVLHERQQERKRSRCFPPLSQDKVDAE